MPEKQENICNAIQYSIGSAGRYFFIVVDHLKGAQRATAPDMAMAANNYLQRCSVEAAISPNGVPVIYRGSHKPMSLE